MSPIGPDRNLDALFEEGFDAIFIATGTHVPMEISLPGDDKAGMLQAMAFIDICTISTKW